MAIIQIDYAPEALDEFCRRWKVAEFSLFGCVLREDFGPESDGLSSTSPGGTLEFSPARR